MPVPPNCVFCRIARGELPANIVHQTETGLAFLDIGPLSEGHLLLIPRTHYDRLEDIPPQALSDLARMLPGLARAVVQVTGAAGYNVLQNNGSVAGQVVEHVHFHLIPRREDDGLGYRWPAGKYPPGRAEELADRFRRALS